MNVATKIRDFLEAQGITQLALSEKTHISPAKLSLSLNNKRRMNFDEYQTICWALGVGVDAFMEPHPPVR